MHRIDDTGVLEDIKPEDDRPAWNKTWQKNFKSKKDSKERKKDRSASIETAFDVCNTDGRVTVKELSEYMGKSEDTVRRHLKESQKFWIENGEVGKK